jgi:carbon monoxide dehydrogenase subunit G
MRFEFQFPVPADQSTAMMRFEDVERMTRCMPGAALEGRREDGSYAASMTVAFGPKRLTFRGKLFVTSDRQAGTGTVVIRADSDVRGTRLNAVVTYQVVKDIPARVPPQSSVILVSEAELTGVLANFATTGGVAFAEGLMQEFARRLAADFRTATSEPPPGPETNAPVLQMHRLALNALWAWFAAMTARFRARLLEQRIFRVGGRK